jgi:hypothetical protein
VSMYSDQDVTNLHKLVVALSLDIRLCLCRIESIEAEIQMAKTKNENAILAVAASLGSVAQSMSQAVNRIEQKVATLTQQAQGQPVQEPEDLNDELGQLGSIAGELEQTAARLNQIAPEVAAGEPQTAPSDTGSGQVPADSVNTDDEPGVVVAPIEHNTSEVTPLSGVSGGTNGAPTGDPQQPGTSSANPTEAGSSTPSNTGSVDSEDTGTAVGADPAAEGVVATPLGSGLSEDATAVEDTEEDEFADEEEDEE